MTDLTLCVGWVRHIGCGELEFRQAGHPNVDKRLPALGWRPVFFLDDVTSEVSS